MKWEAEFHNEFVPEYNVLPEDVQNELLAIIEVLGASRPAAWAASRGYAQRLEPREYEGNKIRCR